jgi:CRP/FNR family transcriptional regulator
MPNPDLHKLDLPPDIWKPLSLHHPAVPYGAGQIIYLQDTTADRFYYLKDGRVKAYISSEEGTERVLTTYRSGDLFGEASFFDELPRVSSAVAVTDCVLVPIDRAMVRQELSEDPELALALLKYLSRTVRLLSAQVDNMAFLRSDQRIARYLISLPRTETGLLHVSQDEIAAAVTANRVTVNRILQRFAHAGLVETGYGTVRLLDVAGLERL